MTSAATTQALDSHTQNSPAYTQDSASMSSVQDDLDFKDGDRSSSIQTSTNSDDGDSDSLDNEDSTIHGSKGSTPDLASVGFYSGPSLNNSMLSSKRHAQYVRKSLVVSPSWNSIHSLKESGTQDDARELPKEVPTAKISIVNSPSIQKLGDILTRKVSGSLDEFTTIPEDVAVDGTAAGPYGSDAGLGCSKTASVSTFNTFHTAHSGDTSDGDFDVEDDLPEPEADTTIITTNIEDSTTPTVANSAAFSEQDDIVRTPVQRGVSDVAAEQPDLISLSSTVRDSPLASNRLSVNTIVQVDPYASPKDTSTTTPQPNRHLQSRNTPQTSPGNYNDLFEDFQKRPAVKAEVDTEEDLEPGDQIEEKESSPIIKHTGGTPTMREGDLMTPNLFQSAFVYNEPVQGLHLMQPGRTLVRSIATEQGSIHEIGYDSDYDESVDDVAHYEKYYKKHYDNYTEKITPPPNQEKPKVTEKTSELVALEKPIAIKSPAKAETKTETETETETEMETAAEDIDDLEDTPEPIERSPTPPPKRNENPQEKYLRKHHKSLSKHLSVRVVFDDENASKEEVQPEEGEDSLDEDMVTAKSHSEESSNSDNKNVLQPTAAIKTSAEKAASNELTAEKEETEEEAAAVPAAIPAAVPAAGSTTAAQESQHEPSATPLSNGSLVFGGVDTPTASFDDIQTPSPLQPGEFDEVKNLPAVPTESAEPATNSETKPEAQKEVPLAKTEETHDEVSKSTPNATPKIEQMPSDKKAKHLTFKGMFKRTPNSSQKSTPKIAQSPVMKSPAPVSKPSPALSSSSFATTGSDRARKAQSYAGPATKKDAVTEEPSEKKNRRKSLMTTWRSSLTFFQKSDKKEKKEKKKEKRAKKSKKELKREQKAAAKAAAVEKAATEKKSKQKQKAQSKAQSKPVTAPAPVPAPASEPAQAHAPATIQRKPAPKIIEPAKSKSVAYDDSFRNGPNWTSVETPRTAAANPFSSGSPLGITVRSPAGDRTSLFSATSGSSIAKLHAGESLFPKTLDSAEIESIVSLERTRSRVSTAGTSKGVPVGLRSPAQSLSRDASIVKMVNENESKDQITMPDGTIVVKSPDLSLNAPSFVAKPTMSILRQSPQKRATLVSAPERIILPSTPQVQTPDVDGEYEELDMELSDMIDMIQFSDGDDFDTSFDIGSIREMKTPQILREQPAEATVSAPSPVEPEHNEPEVSEEQISVKDPEPEVSEKEVMNTTEPALDTTTPNELTANINPEEHESEEQSENPFNSSSMYQDEDLSELPATPAKDSELPATPAKDSELPATPAKDSEIPATPAKDSEIPDTEKDDDLVFHPTSKASDVLPPLPPKEPTPPRVPAKDRTVTPEDTKKHSKLPTPPPEQLPAPVEKEMPPEPVSPSPVLPQHTRAPQGVPPSLPKQAPELVEPEEDAAEVFTPPAQFHSFSPQLEEETAPSFKGLRGPAFDQTLKASTRSAIMGSLANPADDYEYRYSGSSYNDYSEPEVDFFQTGIHVPDEPTPEPEYVPEPEPVRETKFEPQVKPIGRYSQHFEEANKADETEDEEEEEEEGHRPHRLSMMSRFGGGGGSGGGVGGSSKSSIKSQNNSPALSIHSFKHFSMPTNEYEYESEKPKTLQKRRAKSSGSLNLLTHRNKKKKAGVQFSSRIVLYTTYAEDEYDRQPEQATCNSLTPELALEIKNELNEFKSQMEVNEESRCYTHFF